MLADFATSPDADLADRAADTDLFRATFAAADALAAGRALFAYGT
jgi:hypothetical protein